VQLFTIIFQRPIEFGISIGITLLMVVIFLRAAMSAERRENWVRRITGPNGKFVFGFLFLVYLVASCIVVGAEVVAAWADAAAPRRPEGPPLPLRARITGAARSLFSSSTELPRR